MSSSEAIPVGHIKSAWCDDDDAGHHQPRWHHHHLPSGHLGKVKAVNVLIKGSPSPPLNVAQLFFQHRHLETQIQKITSDNIFNFFSKLYLSDIAEDTVKALESGQVHHRVNTKLVP